MKWRKPKVQLAREHPEPSSLVAFLEDLSQKTKLPLLDERLLSLAGLAFELVVDSETTMLRFLENQPQNVFWDKIERRRYLLSGTIKALRELYLELKDQKIAKALLIFLADRYPALFSDLWPKHGIVPPQGVRLRLLGPEELASLELPLRLRHEYLLAEFVLAGIEVLELYRLGLLPVVWREEDDLFVLPEIFPGFEEIRFPECPPALKPYLLPQATAKEGFLYLPLLSFFSLFTRTRAEDSLLRPALKDLLDELQKRYPEPFGLLPQD